MIDRALGQQPARREPGMPGADDDRRDAFDRKLRTCSMGRRPFDRSLAPGCVRLVDLDRDVRSGS